MKNSIEENAVISDVSTIELLKMYFWAIRPKTLPLSATPILLGTFLAQPLVEKIDWLIAFLAALSAVFIQIGTNLVNDALDFKKGADADRIGPRRLTQTGVVQGKMVLMTGFICFACAVLSGIPLVIHGGWPLILVLLFSVTSGYLYTGGPFPLAYYGLGDLFVLLFFGLVSTSAAFFLQTNSIDFRPLVAGTQLGLLAIVPIAINNLRDIVGDAKVNKRTLPVRFGKTFGRVEVTICSFLPFILGAFWASWGYALAALLPCLTIPLTYTNVKAIWDTDSSPIYHEFLARSALTQLLFAFFLVIGYLIG